MKIIALLLCIICLVSCRYYAVKKYHLNKEFSFKSKSQYLDHFHKKKIGNLSDLLYLDTTSYINFYMQKINKEGAVAYLGCFLNDSTSIKKSDLLDDNTSCSGRILQEIRNNLYINKDSVKNHIQKECMGNFTYREIATGNPVNLNKEEGVKILLVYSTGFGTYYDALYREIYKMKNESQTKSKIYILSIDPVYTLK